MDRDASSRQLFETLRARLGSLSEALFDKAPCTRRSASRPATNSFRGSGPDLLILCRGLSAVDTVLRRFEQKWYRLTVEDRLAIWNEWDIRLERLHGDVRDPCGLCFVAPGFGAPAAATSYDCAVCSHKVTSFTEEMERYARRLDDNLEYLAAVSSSPPPVAHPTSEPSPAPEPPATPVPPPVPDDTAKDDRIRELETKCQDYSEILEQTQDVLQAVNAEKTAQEETAKALLEDLATLRKAREESEALSKLLGNDLQEAMNGIEKYAEDLDDLMRWQTAQVAYAQLHRLLHKQLDRIIASTNETTADIEQRRKELDVKSLRLRHKQSVALMRLGRHQEAEVMCAEVWDRRELLRVETSKTVVRALVKDYCDMLVRNGKHDEAEREYRLLLLNELHGTTDREDEKERFIIYTRLGDIKMEQKKYIEAAMQHKDALEKIMQLQPLDVDQAAESVVKCLVAQRMQEEAVVNLDSTIGKYLETIWVSRPENFEKPSVLACGHEHGIRLVQEGKDESAMAVLLAVWERRKALVGHEDHRPGAMETALALVDLSVKTDNLSRLETLFHWITQNPIPDQTEGDRLWYRYRLGCVQAVLAKYAVAGNNLRKALTRQRELFGADDPDTLQYTQLLAEVLRRERRIEEAITLVRDIWETRQRYLNARGGVLQAILRIGHIYGDILAESNDPKTLLAAETILRDVWEMVSTNLSTIQLSLLSLNQLSGLISAGDCYAFVLMKRNKFAAAKDVLAIVLNWKRWPSLNCDPAAVERTAYLLNKANGLEQKEAEAKKVKYQPSNVTYHILRLRYLLDRWYNPGAVTGYITNS
ncbi:hypothetical protein MGG_02744 [Pyricularia oryzae 70-15]|uniref:Uncharacterized protein n=3 Tax=Pyricularia oryzae TaxID=318829 RepID=G5EHR2_PYRO7|nr:uncharacterized protein MGG_02744 [Pyricularia oryzae 70-15]ELQ36179.1 hypothetical protein OOU_Y34scaffold00666g40 [Pyricularia oryzae Y34]KAI7921362.1 hypothetical protein M9X92_005452 [Pyricularia oryzae]EAQ71084.1 hypothetical protein MGCH7_ch7g491 [Pyricularia oryzae 70-15]EHA46269.1 hypothetical protein MGG_02744 [Pyricularia oryzae 70-15]KAI7921517.1 hypothetical protein M0657_006070 [Pyricularia oryzae]